MNIEYSEMVLAGVFDGGAKDGGEFGCLFPVTHRGNDKLGVINRFHCFDGKVISQF
jgi:hypothetical protein